MLEDLSGWAIIISFFGVGVASLSFLLNYQKSKMENLSGESQFIQGIQHSLTNSDYEFDKIKTKNDCLNYVFNYLNTLDRLCYFDSRGWLSNDIIQYFKNYLGWGLEYYEWVQKENIIPNGKITSMLPYLKPTCEKHKIQKTNMSLPEILKKFSTLN